MSDADRCGPRAKPAASAAERLAALRAYSRHIVLFSLAAGLALGPVSRAGTLAAAVVAGVVAGRRSLKLVAIEAVLVGAVRADARLAALDRGRLPSMHVKRWAGRAVLLEPVRQRGPRRAVARVRLRGLDEVAVARMQGRRRWPGVGAIVALAGTVAPLGEYDRYPAVNVTPWGPVGRPSPARPR